MKLSIQNRTILFLGIGVLALQEAPSVAKEKVNDNDQNACLRGLHSDVAKNVKEEYQITEAIKAGDSATVKKIIDGDSFRCPTGLSFSNVGRSESSDNTDAKVIRDFMNYAVAGSQAHCLDDIIIQLIDAGIPVTTDQARGIVTYGCRSATAAVFKIMKPNEIADIVNTFANNFSEILRERYDPNNADATKVTSDQLENLYTIATTACQGEKVDVICKTAPLLASKKKEIPEIMAMLNGDAARRKSPQFLIDQACYMQANISRYQAGIKREKEIGKISGTVNVVSLHEYGELIVNQQKEIQTLLDEYKTRTGKAANLKKSCKNMAVGN